MKRLEGEGKIGEDGWLIFLELVKEEVELCVRNEEPWEKEKELVRKEGECDRREKELWEKAS